MKLRALSLGCALLALPALTACQDAEMPRERARSTIALLAEGVRVGDLACASIAAARKDLELAESCAKAYDEARENLAIAEDALDIADEVARRNMPCAVETALEALRRLRDRIVGYGGHTPPAVEDAFKLAPSLARGCRG